MRGAFFELFSAGSERSARCLCAPGASRFHRLLRLAFLQERSVEKNKNLSGKAPHIIAFFSIVQSNEWRGGLSVVVTKVSHCLESPETGMMDEKLVVSVAGFTRSCIFLRFLLILQFT